MTNVQRFTDHSTHAAFYVNDATPGQTYGSRNDATNQNNALDAATSHRQLSQLPIGGNPQSQAMNAAYMHPGLRAAYAAQGSSANPSNYFENINYPAPITAESLGIENELEELNARHQQRMNFMAIHGEAKVREIANRGNMEDLPESNYAHYKNFHTGFTEQGINDVLEWQSDKTLARMAYELSDTKTGELALKEINNREIARSFNLGRQ